MCFEIFKKSDSYVKGLLITGSAMILGQTVDSEGDGVSLFLGVEG